MQPNPKIKFVEMKNCRYIYLIDNIEIELREYLNESNVVKRLYYVNNCLVNKTDFRESSIDMSLRDFMLFGYLFFYKEMAEYFVYYINELILHCDKKKLTEMLVLKYIFNVNTSQVQCTIHSSTDKSVQKYNDKLMEFVKVQIMQGKEYLIKRLIIDKNIGMIHKIVNLVTLNSFLQICGDYLEEALSYFDFVIKEMLLPTNVQLSLNGVIACAVGFSNKRTKDNKNLFKSKQKEKLYMEIETLKKKYKSNFFLNKVEFKYLNRIEEALNGYKKLNENELKELDPYRILIICMEIFKEKFFLYLNQIADDLIKNYIVINRINIIMRMFDDIDNVKANHIYTYYKMNNTNTMLEDFLKSKFRYQIKLLGKFKINFKDDIWTLYWRIKEQPKKVTIDFSELNNNMLKNEIKQYYKFVITKECQFKSEEEAYSRKITSRSLVIKSIKYLQENLKINSAMDIKLIHVYKLIKYLQIDYKTKNNKKLRISTIVGLNSILRTFIDWLIENKMNGLSTPENNAFQYVVFKGVYNKNTDVIPECVIDKMLLYINELREDIQRMLLIMINCGLRYKEVAYLEEDCISESNNDYKILKYIPYKVLEARRRNGLDDYHRIVIDDELYKEIEEQIAYTKDLREKYCVKEIFLTLGINDNLCMIDRVTYCSFIQNLIDKHNIVDEQCQIWKITSRQYRKTLVVDMITKGKANEYEVASYLGHLDPSTTKKYYAEVRKKKLADLNCDFFKKKFELLIEEKHLDGFSEEERKSLYVDFCLNTRDVEYGVCTKAFSIDSCNSRGDIFACATCSKICTGKKYLKRWEDLYYNQKNRVESMVKVYELNEIVAEKYESFKEYEREKYLLDSFKTVLDELRRDYGGGN